MSTGMILTTAGRNLLALALTGKPLVFTRAFCGDGSLNSGQSPSSLTALISPKRELPIQSMNTLQGVGTAEIVVEMTNKGLTQGFFVREYGLFALHPDTQTEVLYSYRNSGDESSYLEGDNGIDLVNYTLSIVTVIDQAPNVSAVLVNSNQYVTITRLDSRLSDLFKDFQSPVGFWSFGREGECLLRPATLQQTRYALWGDADIKGFNARIERLEDAINQTRLALEILEAYPGFSHYLAEDFREPDTLDTFSAKVTSIVAGDDSIDVEPLDGMLPGSLYTVSDGINSETVRVQSINIENGVQRVILEDVIQNTYILDTTKIIRTSASIQSEEATGSGVRQRISWEPALTWRGTGESETFTVTLDTTVASAKVFDMTGSATMDKDGNAALG